MQPSVIKWDIYEVTSQASSLNGVMLRGRIRKFGIEKKINILVENTEDKENAVRFAVTDNTHADHVIDYLHSILKDVNVDFKLKNVSNPVLSKLKVNDESRYSL